MHDFTNLKAFYQKSHEGFNEPFSKRMSRALSWLERAEQEENDADAGFIFYWISFNASYSVPPDDSPNDEKKGERFNFEDYFELLVDNDTHGEIYKLVHDRFKREIKGLMDNKYIFPQFWKAESQLLSAKHPPEASAWKRALNISQKAMKKALDDKKTDKILEILFGRLYVLRNQLIHGSATWNGPVNREQVVDGHKIISQLQPIFLSVMMKHPHKNWRGLSYFITEADNPFCFKSTGL